ncbi:GNAT family N-acetyltransferase [Sphingobacterium sp. PU5-4]|uniref:GNAT family N-acetyltransferase n=1 Tax=Sphingobacterium tenebrionis TaxID=3111775 RepID=A0ABU8I917_9SPHI
MLERKTLSNDLVKLISLIKEDFEWLYAAASDPEIWEQHPDNMRYTPLGFTKYFQKLLQNDIAYLIVDNETERVIGGTSFYDYNADQKSVAIGYTFLAKNYWGGKYNQSIKQLMMNFAFETLDEVFFHVRKGNLRSQKALEKINAQFVREYPAPDHSGIQLVYSIKK